MLNQLYSFDWSAGTTESIRVATSLNILAEIFLDSLEIIWTQSMAGGVNFDVEIWSEIVDMYGY